MNERRMKRTPRHKPDPIETQIEVALSPGAFRQESPSFLERAKDRWGVGRGGGRK